MDLMQKQIYLVLAKWDTQVLDDIFIPRLETD